MVRIELTTRGSSGHCSTTELHRQMKDENEVWSGIRESNPSHQFGKLRS